MSKNSRKLALEKPKKKQDRRVTRTRGRLAQAMIALMHEKPFDSITVQEVLNRADVGRSTFYLHYKDKDDLFFTDLEEFLEMVANSLTRRGEQSERILPVQELFAHVGEAKQFYRALVESGRIHDFYELARGQLARGVERRLKGMARFKTMKPAELAATSQAYAGAMLALLKWWMDTGTKQSPEEMDRLFHRIVRGEAGR